MDGAITKQVGVKLTHALRLSVAFSVNECFAGIRMGSFKPVPTLVPLFS